MFNFDQNGRFQPEPTLADLGLSPAFTEPDPFYTPPWRDPCYPQVHASQVHGRGRAARRETDAPPDTDAALREARETIADLRAQLATAELCRERLLRAEAERDRLRAAAESAMLRVDAVHDVLRERHIDHVNAADGVRLALSALERRNSIKDAQLAELRTQLGIEPRNGTQRHTLPAGE